jgi:AcrR family transcriptional regulator
MKNKEIQEQRMRGYFIQAAKEILVGEGIKSLSVRSVSERAGYSYTTLYSYFIDLNDLIFYCVKDFYQECFNFVNNNNDNNAQGLEGIEQKAMSYIKYFINYPSVFELFFIERVLNFGNKEETIKLITNSLTSISKQNWDHLLTNNIIDTNSINKKQVILQLLVTGLLIHYINRRDPAQYSEFMSLATEQIHDILFGTL